MGTLTNYITRYVAEGVATGRFTGTGPQAQRQQLARLNRWHGDRALNRLTRASILKWLGEMEEAGLSPRTRRSYLVAASGFTKWLKREGVIDVDPCADVPRPKIPRAQPRALSHDAVRKCLAACLDDRDRAIVWLAVGMGLRRCEIVSVRWCDYDDTAGTLRVVGKGGHERVVPVPREVARVLESIRGPWSYPIIGRNHPGRDGIPLSLRMVSQLVREITERAGVKRAAWDGVGVHSFRHTAATDVLTRSGDLRAVQSMLGHANLSTTSVYVGLANMAELRTAMEGRDYLDQAA